MMCRANYCLFFALFVLGLIPANAQLTYRVFIKDLNPARKEMGLWVFEPNTSTLASFNGGLAEVTIDSGKTIVTIATKEVTMVPRELEINAPEQDGDTIFVTTSSIPKHATVTLALYFHDTVTATAIRSSEYQIGFVGIADSSLRFRPSGARRAVMAFDSIPFGTYQTEPLYDTAVFLKVERSYLLPNGDKADVLSIAVRPRSNPKFKAYSYSIERTEWADNLPGERTLASGAKIDDDIYERELPFVFPSSPATGKVITIGSNGSLVLARDTPNRHFSYKPLFSQLFVPVVVSVFSRDLKGHPTSRITESEGIRNGQAAYTVSWYDMANFEFNFEESFSHLSGRATIVESGEIGITFGPIDSKPLDVEIGIRGSDHYDLLAVTATNSYEWQKPKVVRTSQMSVLGTYSAPAPGTQIWFTPLSTSVETEQPTSLNPQVFPCPASTYVRIRGVALGSLENLSVVTLYSTSGSAVSASCRNDGDDLLLLLDGLASGTYHALIDGKTYVFVVEH